MTESTTALRPALGSVLGRRNPTVKLALLFVLSAVLLFVFDPVTPAATYVVALVAVLVVARIDIRSLLKAHIPFASFGFGLLVVNALSRPGQVRWQAGPLQVSDAGLAIGGSLALRTLTIGVCSIAFVVSTDAVQLVTSLHHQARLGARPTYALLAGYRMLEQLPHEWRTIRIAQAVRAPLRADGSLPRGLWGFGRAAFALLVGAIRRAERTARSLESRGLGLTPRTTWRPVRLDRSDGWFAAGVLLVLAVVLAASALCGFLSGVGALG